MQKNIFKNLHKFFSFKKNKIEVVGNNSIFDNLILIQDLEYYIYKYNLSLKLNLIDNKAENLCTNLNFSINWGKSPKEKQIAKLIIDKI